MLKKNYEKIPIRTVPLSKLGKGASSSVQTRTQLRPGNPLVTRARVGFQLPHASSAGNACAAHVVIEVIPEVTEHSAFSAGCGWCCLAAVTSNSL